MSSNHELETDIAQLEQDIKKAFRPVIEAVMVFADEIQAAVESIGKSLSVEEPPKRKLMPIQYQQQAHRRIREMHSRRYQSQRW